MGSVMFGSGIPFFHSKIYITIVLDFYISFGATGILTKMKNNSMNLASVRAFLLRLIKFLAGLNAFQRGDDHS